MKKWLRIASLVLKYVLIIFVLGTGLNICINALALQKNEDKQSIELGSYTAKEFFASNAHIQKWDRLVITKDSIQIESPGSKRSSFHYTFNTVDKKVELFTDDGSAYSLNYSNLNSRELTLKGHFDKGDITVKFHKDNQTNSRLMTDEFRWISE